MSEARRWFATAFLLAILTPSLSPALAEEARKVKVRVEPAYPELARRMRIAGVVKVEVTITPAGVIKTTKVIGGNPVLVEASLDALRKWKYEPGPDEVTQLVEFRFTGQ